MAVYELGEAVRTRLFQLVLLAYAGGVGASIYVLVQMVGELESSLAKTLGVPTTERPGALMGTLLQRGELDPLVRAVAGRHGDIAALLHEPIVALWTGGTCMALLPLVLVFSASGSIASEVKSRSIRYLLVRTGRLEIGLGKLLGQLLIAGVAAALGGCVAWVLGMTLMVGTPPAALAAALADRCLRAALWSLPFAGLGLAASQLVSNGNGARMLAALALLGMLVTDHQLDVATGTDTLGRLADLARQLLATNAWPDYWSTDIQVPLAAVLRGVALAVVYAAVGHAVFSRRDL